MDIYSGKAPKDPHCCDLLVLNSQQSTVFFTYLRRITYSSVNSNPNYLIANIFANELFTTIYKVTATYLSLLSGTNLLYL